MHVTTPIATLRAQSYHLPRNILVEHFVVRSGSKRSIEVRGDQDRMGFFFCLSGHDCITVEDTGEVVHIRKGVCGVYRETKGLNRLAVYDPATLFSLLSVSMPLDTMEGLFQQGCCRPPLFADETGWAENRPYAFRFMPVQPQINTAVSQIVAPPVDSGLSHIYLEGKALEIASLMLQTVTSGCRGHGFSPTLNSRETASLYHARELLADHLQDPPSLAELSRQCGLNHNRLNCGFKELFGQTPYDHLRTLRLEKARKLLASGECNVTEACFDVGYSNLSHFAKMYRKHFGLSPIKDKKRLFALS
nr:AraC family transcriptional regulator [uncultured Desulfuromonas sp.]